VTLDGASLEWALDWGSGGGLARFASVRAEAVVLVTTVPSPPGSRLVGTLLAEPRDAVRIKVHACRAQPDGTFRLEGRVLDLTREMRVRLEAMAQVEVREA